MGLGGDVVLGIVTPGLGANVGLGLLSGSDRLRASRVNFDFAVLLDADLRQLTSKQVPVRFSGNVGWTLDNSIKLVDWGAIDDQLSREALRFAAGANHSRVTTRLAVDFPLNQQRPDAQKVTVASNQSGAAPDGMGGESVEGFI